ncbi:MAG: type III secretion system inner membrane ring subunit SctD [Gammaproteobacteria bacterium]|nr:type III secretion system inner membrane ring subunit SctD [Gammaproteobacteria bacterium]
MPEANFILKVLSGLHTGAECLLPPGVTRLGKSMQCDLVLHDQGIADEHFSFSCSPEGIAVQCLAQDVPVLLDGAPQTGPFIIREFGIVTTAALYLAVGAEDQLWRIPPPQELFARPGAAESQPEAAEDNETEAENVTATDNEGEDENPEDEQAGASPGPTEAAAPGRKRRRLGLFVKLFAPAALVLGAAGLWLYENEDEPAAVDTGPTAAEIREVAARYRLDAEFELEGRALVTRGYALNHEDEYGFVRDMRARGILVKSSLVISAQLRNNLQHTLDQYMDPAHYGEVSVSIDASDIKTLHLRGYVQDAEQWSAILARAVDDVDTIHYTAEVTHWDDGLLYLRGLLDEYALGEAVYLEEDKPNNRIVLYDRYADEADQSRLLRLVGEYREAYAYPEALVGADIEQALPPPEFAGTRLTGASFNARPYLLFDDRQRYFVGSVAPGGYQVEEINEDFAVLLRADKRYQYSFDDRGGAEPVMPAP